MDARPADLGRKGRGTARQPPHRFTTESRAAEDDGWGGLAAQAAEAPTPTTVTHERVTRALSRNDSPDVPFDRSVNPYRGCEHGCVYCFARPSHGALGLSAGLDFETRLVVKDNVAEALRAELARPGYRPATLYLSGVTDAWQPLERRERRTRAVLELLAETRHPVGVVTKGALITRDMDLLAPMASQGLAEVCVSITTLDADLARRLEPRAAAPHVRLEAIRALSAAGVPTGVILGPVLPAVTDHEIEAILAAAAEAGVSSASFTMLRLPYELVGLWDAWLADHAPDRRQRALARQREVHGGRLNDPRFGSRMRGEGPYYDMIRDRFHLARRRLGLRRDRLTLRTDLFRPPARDARQLALF
jgi:DNA repair photolyase